MEAIKRFRVVLSEKQVPGRGLRKSPDLLITHIVPSLILSIPFIIQLDQTGRRTMVIYPLSTVKVWLSYAESQCWIQGPYYHPPDQPVPSIFDKSYDSQRLTYMAYLPYIFSGAALILYSTYFFCSLLMRPFATRFEAVYSGCDMIVHSKDENVLQKVKDRITRVLLELQADRMHIIYFSIARFGYILSLFVVGAYFSYIFKTNYFVLGFRSAFFMVGDNALKVNERFPLKGYCSVTFRELANGQPKNTYILPALMPSNLMLSKLVGFVWILLYVVSFPLALTDTIYTMSYFLSKGRGFNSKSLMMFLLKDSVTPSVYEAVKAALNMKVVEIYQMKHALADSQE